ncbi:hypothetical protein HDR70_03805 [bacterium]|nr:hypothetical protein [bacterium]
MINQEYYIKCLKSDIEKKLRRTMRTPTDFNYFASQIEAVCNEKISVHTLMRLWGYLESHIKPSVTTLSILSRFLGFMDIEEYKIDLSVRLRGESEFIASDTVSAEKLDPDDEIIISWDPDRKIKIKYLGNYNFEVISNSNSKLEEGLKFRCLNFSKGLPFVVYIVDEDEGHKNYIGGKKWGIKSLSLIKKQIKK